jgi:hypothetical protein
MTRECLHRREGKGKRLAADVNLTLIGIRPAAEVSLVKMVILYAAPVMVLILPILLPNIFLAVTSS